MNKTGKRASPKMTGNRSTFAFLSALFILSVCLPQLLFCDTWDRRFGGSKDDIVNAVHPTKDGGYIVAGFTSSFGVAGYDVWVLKLDIGGKVQWQKTYWGTIEHGPNHNADYARAVKQTKDGGYIVAGGPHGNSFWFLKLDGGGNVQWLKVYGGSGYEPAETMQQTRDGGYIVAGYIESYYESNLYQSGNDFYLSRHDSAGNVRWEKRYGGTPVGEPDVCIPKDRCHDTARAVQQTTDGGFIVVGEARSFEPAWDPLNPGKGEDFWVLKLDSGGNVKWQKTYGGADEDSPKAVQQTKDGGYIVEGGTRSFGAVGSDFWLLKLDRAGKVKWQKRYGGKGDDSAAAVRQTEDGGYAVFGATTSFGAQGSDFWVLKLDDTGNISTRCNFSIKKTSARVRNTVTRTFESRAEIIHDIPKFADTNATVRATKARAFRRCSANLK